MGIFSIDLIRETIFALRHSLPDGKSARTRPLAAVYTAVSGEA